MADDGPSPFDADLTVGPPTHPSISNASAPDGDQVSLPSSPGPRAAIWRADNPIGTEALIPGSTARSPFDADLTVANAQGGTTQQAERPPSPYDSAKGGIMSRAWWTGLPSRIASAVTGEGRIPEQEAETPQLFNDLLGPKFRGPNNPQDVGSYDVPGTAPSGLPEPTAGEQALMLSYMLGARPDQLEASALKAYPGSKVDHDAQGNPILRMADGSRYYISKPGMRAQDFAGLVLPSALSAATALAPEALLPLRAASGFWPTIAGAALRTAAQGGTQAATEAGKGAVIAGPGGGDTGADPWQIAFAGAGGAGGQIMREIATLWQASYGAGGKLIADVGRAADTDPVTPDMLTTTGKTLFANAGRDPGSLTVGQLKALQANVRPVTKALAESQPPAPGMPSPPRAAIEQVQYPELRYTSGTISQSQPQLNLENRGLFGDAAAEMKGNQAANLSAYQGAQRDLVSSITGSTLGDEATQGAALLKTLRDRAEANAAATTAAYSKLDTKLPNGTTVPFSPQSESALGANGMRFAPGNSGLILSDVAQQAAGATPELTPYSTQIIKQIRNLVTLPSQSSLSGYVPNGFNLAEYDQARRVIQDLVNSAKTAWQSGSATGAAKTDYAMATGLLKALDQRVNQAPALGLATGDTSRLTTLRAAQDLRASQAAFENPETPEARRFMQDALAKDPRTGAYQTYDGQQAVDSLYGKGELQANGFTPQILDHLQTQFRGDPAALANIRTPGLQRLIAGRNPGTVPLNAQPWTSEVNRLTRQIQGTPASDVVSRLASPDELARIGQLRDVAQTLGTQRALGTSGTPQLGAEFLRRFLRTAFLREFVQDPQINQALRATSGRLTPQMFPRTYRPPVTFPLAPGGGLLGAEGYRQR